MPNDENDVVDLSERRKRDEARKAVVHLLDGQTVYLGSDAFVCRPSVAEGFNEDDALDNFENVGLDHMQARAIVTQMRHADFCARYELRKEFDEKIYRALWTQGGVFIAILASILVALWFFI